MARTRLVTVLPEALLSYAKEYQLAASRLLLHHKEVEAPIYFLYTHAIELAFKVYLRSHGVPVQSKHLLSELLDECRRNGLRLNPDDSDLTSVIHLLESENKRHGFRYFVFEGTARPEITFLCDVVDRLMLVVAEAVKRSPSADADKKAVLKFTVGRAEKK